MKSLTDYLDKNFVCNQEDTMAVRRIMAPQGSSKEVLWNSTDDRWSRRAKHPLQVSEAINMTDNNWEKGDVANYKGTDVTIEIPNGPNNTIGVIYEGKLKMVLNDTLTESVMGGMQPLGPINRMMQLAGLSVPTIIDPAQAVSEDETSADTADVITEADATNMFQQLMKANFSGEYRNNPGAARLATVGQVLIGLNTVINDMKAKNEIPADVVTKLDTAVGLGAYLMQSAKKMLQP